ncbi:SdpI family protein [Lentilactobacillus parafarraginis]|jgi:uncharacterized membrane protein|uniref:SdpI family protein n=1 Tax=Lentilactobacillus parafarraginis TaxID=390842 RepID=A0A5R9CZK4_9LACO|nr:SdpI family protein [Lentilactobacillus parafarraginis]
MGLEFSVGIFVILILAALSYFLSKEKKPSSIIGYRTKRSRSSEANWQKSQKIFYYASIFCQALLVVANLFMTISVELDMIVIIGYFVIISIYIENDLKHATSDGSAGPRHKTS